MNLHAMLGKRAAEGRPVRIGIVGCGKFASMFLAQAPRTPGLHVAAIADLAPQRARESLARVGWPAERYAATGLDAALRGGGTWLTEDAQAVCTAGPIDVVVEATGDPVAAIGHCLSAFAAGKPVVQVTVEADALAGPLLARRAREAGVVYSLAYGDQPALICELVDWARAAGFEVVAAGRGHKWLPHYCRSTPETVWEHYGLSPEDARIGGLNPKMFNSFLDGTKPAIESAAVANATGLTPAPGGLGFPPAGVDDLPRVMRPRAEGGALDHRGQVEVVSSLAPDGSPVFRDVRFGVFVAFAAANDYVARCFREYGVTTDETGRYACMYKKWHLIGLELGISIASVALRGEPTGAPDDFRADAVATAKRGLAAGETLDGEGGCTVWGRLMPAADSLALGALPIGLAHGARLLRPVAEGDPVTRADVAIDETAAAARFRREMEAAFAPAPAAAARAGA